jgi:hypothetical protein
MKNDAKSVEQEKKTTGMRVKRWQLEIFEEWGGIMKFEERKMVVLAT